MQRILGQAPDLTWHVASATYTTTMHTRCNRWLRVIAFAVETGGAFSPVPAADPRCSRCAVIAYLEVAAG